MNQLPADVDAEEALIGALILDCKVLDDVISIIYPEDFFAPSLALIYAAIVKLTLKGSAIDAVTIAGQLESENIDYIKIPELISYMANTPSSKNAPAYATRIAECSRRRKLVHAGKSIIDYGSDPKLGFNKALDQSEAELFSLHARESSETADLYDGLYQWREKLVQRKEAISCPLGWPDVDKKIGGLVPARLLVLGARPGIGKTSIAAEMALRVAKNGFGVLFISIEMSYDELIGRLVCRESGLDSEQFAVNQIASRHWAHIDVAIERLALLPLQINELNDPTVIGVRTAIRKATKQLGQLGLVVVDYIQLMSFGSRRSENRQLEISEISRSLKLLAREFKIPILALSQLNRAVETRGFEKRPVLADLRDSGSIESEADQVFLLYRDEYYDPASSDKGVAELNIAKNRHGSGGVVKLTVNMGTGTWSSHTQRTYS